MPNEQDKLTLDLVAIRQQLEQRNAEVADELAQLKADLAARDRQIAVMRAEYDRLAGMACEFIGPDEDGKPECVCCGMSLETPSKGHKRDCLAAALLDNGTQHIFTTTPPAPRLFTAEEVRPLVEALTRINEISVIDEDMGCAVNWAGDALAHARACGMMEDK